MLYHLERTLFIPRPRQEVFPFFADPANLERITPPFLRFRIVTPPPIAMRPGAIIDYRLRLYGLPFGWRTRIEAFQPPDLFIDSQVSGPYKLWRHRHDFADVPGGTEMRDRIDYQLPFGPIGHLAHTLLVRRSVEQIFECRNATISGILGR